MRKPLLATILVLAWLSPSLAQNNFVTPGGSEVDGKVEMCLNGSSQAVPCGTPTNPLPVTGVTSGALGANTPIDTPTTAASLILKASAGNLYTLNTVAPTTVTNLLLFDSATLPGNGTVSPIKCFPVTGGQSFSLAYTPAPIHFLNGLVAAFSTATSCFTLTLASTTGNPFLSGEVQ